MAHVEFTFQNLQLVGSSLDTVINLNCWRVTMVFLSKKSPNITVDGVPWAFLYDLDKDTKGFQRLELGGLVVDGKPVNVKHDLRITTPPSDPLQMLIVRQFYVP